MFLVRDPGQMRINNNELKMRNFQYNALRFNTSKWIRQRKKREIKKKDKQSNKNFCQHKKKLKAFQGKH